MRYAFQTFKFYWCTHQRDQMSLPVYKPEQLDALARVFAAAALHQLIREFDLEVRPDEPAAEQRRPLPDAKYGTAT
jgi:hypothetical protein